VNLIEETVVAMSIQVYATFVTLAVVIAAMLDCSAVGWESSQLQASYLLSML
jgi:hypothetical protein